MLRWYFGEILSHKPDRSGLPSGVRGAGAERFGLPSGMRGIPAVGWFSHCAAAGALNANVMRTMSEAFIVTALQSLIRLLRRISRLDRLDDAIELRDDEQFPEPAARIHQLHGSRRDASPRRTPA